MYRVLYKVADIQEWKDWHPLKWSCTYFKLAITSITHANLTSDRYLSTQRTGTNQKQNILSAVNNNYYRQEHHTANKTANHHNPHDLSNWDSCTTRKLAHQHTFSQSVGLLRICHVFSVTCQTVFHCTMSDIIYIQGQWEQQ